MKKILTILLSILALASCAKEKRTYEYHILDTQTINAKGSYVQIICNEYNDDGIRINSYSIDPVVIGQVYTRKSAPGACYVTTNIRLLRDGMIIYDCWLSKVLALAGSKSIIITDATVAQRYEPSVK